MTLFWVITALLVVLAAVIFVAPLYIGKDEDQTVSRDELNKAFFKDRINELEAESTEGLVSDRDEMVVELQQSLLDDVPAQKAQAATKVSPWIVLPGLVVLVAVTYASYFKFGNLEKVEAWHHTTNQLPELSKRLMGQGEQLSDFEMQQLALGLRTRLQATPEDAMGWLLLGRVSIANRDMNSADGAMKNAFRLEPENPQIQLTYAQTLMMMGNESQSTYARKLLRNILSKDHTNIQAMSLLAFDAFESSDYKRAIAYWQMMLRMTPDDDPRREMLTRSIQRAESRLQAVSNPVEAAAKRVEVEVALSPEVELPEQGIVFVSVHPEDGSAMPIAVRRLPLAAFPVIISLSDEDSMIPERQLSSLDKMIIRARIDSDGNITTKQGDWYGESDIVELGASTSLQINQRY